MERTHGLCFCLVDKRKMNGGRGGKSPPGVLWGLCSVAQRLKYCFRVVSFERFWFREDQKFWVFTMEGGWSSSSPTVATASPLGLTMRRINFFTRWIETALCAWVATVNVRLYNTIKDLSGKGEWMISIRANFFLRMILFMSSFGRGCGRQFVRECKKSTNKKVI